MDFNQLIIKIREMMALCDDGFRHREKLNKILKLNKRNTRLAVRALQNSETIGEKKKIESQIVTLKSLDIKIKNQIKQDHQGGGSFSSKRSRRIRWVEVCFFFFFPFAFNNVFFFYLDTISI